MEMTGLYYAKHYGRVGEGGGGGMLKKKKKKNKKGGRGKIYFKKKKGFFFSSVARGGGGGWVLSGRATKKVLFFAVSLIDLHAEDDELDVPVVELQLYSPVSLQKQKFWIVGDINL